MTNGSYSRTHKNQKRSIDIGTLYQEFEKRKKQGDKAGNAQLIYDLVAGATAARHAYQSNDGNGFDQYWLDLKDAPGRPFMVQATQFKNGEISICIFTPNGKRVEYSNPGEYEVFMVHWKYF